MSGATSLFTCFEHGIKKETDFLIVVMVCKRPRASALHSLGFTKCMYCMFL